MEFTVKPGYKDILGVEQVGVEGEFDVFRLQVGKEGTLVPHQVVGRCLAVDRADQDASRVFRTGCCGWGRTTGQDYFRCHWVLFQTAGGKYVKYYAAQERKHWRDPDWGGPIQCEVRSDYWLKVYDDLSSALVNMPQEVIDQALAALGMDGIPVGA